MSKFEPEVLAILKEAQEKAHEKLDRVNKAYLKIWDLIGVQYSYDLMRPEDERNKRYTFNLLKLLDDNDIELGDGYETLLRRLRNAGFFYNEVTKEWEMSRAIIEGTLKDEKALYLGLQL